MSLKVSKETLIAPPATPAIVHGDSSIPLLDFTLSELLDFQCARYGAKECVVIPWTGARWTYDQLRQESLRLSKALFTRGIRPGDTVAIMAGNCEQYTSVFFACMRIGAILVILNNTYTATEALYALRFTECKMLFTTMKIGRHDNRPLLNKLAKTPGTVDEIVILRGSNDGLTYYDNLIDEGISTSDQVLSRIAYQFNTHDVCNLQFTSGTTGNPKAAMLTHHGLVNNSRFIGDRLAFTENDVLCCPPPLFHCFGLVIGLLACITHGAKVVYPTETFDAAACLHAISDEQCTALHGVPAMFDSIFSLPRPQDFDCCQLRTGMIAGAPIPRHLMELMVNDLGMTEFVTSYGLTEASPTCFNTFHDDPVHVKMTSVGYVMPHAHAKVVDRQGRTMSVGERGELCIAGYQLQRGYWRNEEKTNQVMVRDEDGVLWLHTGDEAVMNDDKTCSITGRFKDIIIRGGENIYPLEIEERLVSHEGIGRAVVVGVKDAHYGEVVGAFLQRAATATATAPGSHQNHDDKQALLLSDEAIRDWVRGTLGRHKAPDHVFWLGEGGVPGGIPLTGSGKVRRFEMASMAERILAGRRAKL